MGIQHAKNLLALAGFEQSLSALDIGTGLGRTMAALTKAGFDTYGLEASETFRRMAIDRVGIPEARLQHSSVEDAIWSDESFHFINFGAVLEHFYDPALCLQRAMQWLKPGGVIHIEVPSSNYLIHSCINIFYKLIGTSYVANLSPMHNPYHLYEFTPKSFARLGERLGFVVAQSSFHPASGRFVPWPLYPVLYRLMMATDTGMQLTVWLRKLAT